MTAALKNCTIKATSSRGYVFYVSGASNNGASLTYYRSRARKYTFDRAVEIMTLDSLKKYQCEIEEVTA